MTFWRAAGLTYINYSTIAARCTREALKKGVDVGKNYWIIPTKLNYDFQPNAEKRAITSIKFQTWENGKPVGKKQ